jgi:uncharacterized protein (DUF433 family)
MVLLSELSYSTPKIGEGIFLTKDVSEILHLPYSKVRDWMFDFWADHTFGPKKNRAINFYTLIEFYTFYQLRLQKISSQQIKKAHSHIANDLQTPYPFASAVIKADGKHVWYEYLEQLIKADGKQQASIKPFIEPFLKKIEFGDNKIAARFFPLTNSRNVVVDPKHQFGQPVIAGTNIQTRTIHDLYVAGETKQNICILYDVSLKQVNDSIEYYKQAS